MTVSAYDGPARCPGCGRVFHGIKGLRSHRSKPYVTLDCRYNEARGDRR